MAITGARLSDPDLPDGWNDLKEFVVANGCFTREENLAIYEKWFAMGPRYLFRAVASKYGLRDKVVCDVGCYYGVNLFYCAPGSYGLEGDPDDVGFAKSLGLRVYQQELNHDDLTDLPKVDVVYASAIIEHVDSPHILLRKLHGVLKPDGLVIVYAPTVPVFPGLGKLPRLGGYFRGTNAGDHVSAFTPATLRFFLRAGRLFHY